MHRVHLFCEDAGQERFLTALLKRFQHEYAVVLEIQAYSATGGHGRMVYRLKKYISGLRKEQLDAAMPDLIVIARDSNCRGLGQTRSELRAVVGEYDNMTIYAIPDPHVERWLLLDSVAFKHVLGLGCSAPDQKCEKERYKQLLIQAILEAGLRPLARGIEHTEDIVNAMDLERMVTADPSLGSLITEVRRTFSSWSRQD